MSANFLDYARYYDCLYQDKDYQAEANFFTQLIHRHETAKSQTVLEFGAGTGKHQPHFRALGFDISGVELSQDMIDIGVKAGFDLHQGDFRSYSHPPKVDVVLALFHVVSYLVTDEDLDKAFHTAHKSLKPGGLFIFDVWHEPAVLGIRPEVRTKHVFCADYSLVRLAEPKLDTSTKTVSITYTFFGKNLDANDWDTFEEYHQLRYFSEKEIAELSERHGFVVCDQKETLTEHDPSPESWGVTYCLIKE